MTAILDLMEQLDAWFPVIVLVMIASALVVVHMFAGFRQSRQGNGSLRRLFVVSLVFSLAEVAPVIVMALIASSLGYPNTISATVNLAWIAVLINFYSLIGYLRPAVMVPHVDQAIPLVNDPDLLERCATISRKIGIKTPVMRMYHALNPGTTNYAWAEGLSAPLVVVTDDLVPKFERGECDAVIAHELAHIANGTLWVLVMTLPFSLSVSTIVALYVPFEVAISLAFAIWTGLYRTASRWFETACDRRAGETVGHLEMASALMKFHVSSNSQKLDRLGHVKSTLGSHPHRDVRISHLTSISSPSELGKLGISYCPETVRQQFWVATAIFWIWLVTIGISLAAAWNTDFAPGVSLLLLIIALGPLALERWQVRSVSKTQSRRMRVRRRWSYSSIVATGAIGLVAVLEMAKSLIHPGIELPWLLFGIPTFPVLLALLFIALIPFQNRLNVNELLAQVRHAIRMKQFGRVIELSQQNPKVVAQSPHLRHNLALATRIVGTRSEAIEILEAMRRDFPDFKFSWFFLFNLYLEEGNATKALEIANAIAAALPEDPGAYLVIGKAQRRLGHLHEADSALRRAMELEPESGDVMAELAALSLDCGDADRATELIETASHLNREANYVDLVKARIGLRTKPIEEARILVEQAIANIRSEPRQFLNNDILQLENELAMKSASRD